jgi:hypothetical protein
MSGPDALGLFLRRTTPAGGDSPGGPPPARRVLVEGAWASRAPATGSRHRQLRREKQPPVSQDSRWKAQGRRCTWARRLGARGKHATVGPVAIARELRGGMGAIAPEGPGGASDAVSPGWHASLQTVPLGKGPRGIGKDAAPGWWHPRRREAAGPGHSSRERGRPPTEARPGGAHPRRAAGATVAEGWLRLFRGTAGENIRKTEKNLLTPLTLEVIATPGVRRRQQPKRSAGCRQSAARR